MDIMTGFEPVVGGSNPSGSTNDTTERRRYEAQTKKPTQYQGIVLKRRLNVRNSIPNRFNRLLKKLASNPLPLKQVSIP